MSLGDGEHGRGVVTRSPSGAELSPVMANDSSDIVVRDFLANHCSIICSMQSSSSLLVICDQSLR